MSETLTVKVTVDTGELRHWAGKHADAGHAGVANVLYEAAAKYEQAATVRPNPPVAAPPPRPLPVRPLPPPDKELVREALAYNKRSADQEANVRAQLAAAERADPDSKTSQVLRQVLAPINLPESAEAANRAGDKR